jgi:hypothetical protein
MRPVQMRAATAVRRGVVAVWIMHSPVVMGRAVDVVYVSVDDVVRRTIAAGAGITAFLGLSQSRPRQEGGS